MHRAEVLISRMTLGEAHVPRSRDSPRVNSVQRAIQLAVNRFTAFASPLCAPSRRRSFMQLSGVDVALHERVRPIRRRHVLTSGIQPVDERDRRERDPASRIAEHDGDDARQSAISLLRGRRRRRRRRRRRKRRRKRRRGRRKRRRKRRKGRRKRRKGRRGWKRGDGWPRLRLFRGRWLE